MINLLIVSHSYDLAKSTMALVSEMKSDFVNIDYIGGIENGISFGTNPYEIRDKINNFKNDKTIIICDLGSSIMNSQIAIELLDEINKKTFIADAPFLEGALVAATSITSDIQLEEILETIKKDSRELKNI